jgi:hypothetical protein
MSVKHGLMVAVLVCCLTCTVSCGAPTDDTSSMAVVTPGTETSSPTHLPTATSTASPQPSDTPSPVQVEGSSRDRHYEPVGGFSYVPPAGWELADSSAIDYQVALGPEEDDFVANITIVDEAFAGTLEEYASASLANMEQFFDAFQVISQGEFKPDEAAPGVRLVTENVQYGRELRQTFYIFDAGAKKLVITCTRLAGGQDALEAVCDQTAKTFRLESE